MREESIRSLTKQQRLRVLTGSRGELNINLEHAYADRVFLISSLRFSRAPRLNATNPDHLFATALTAFGPRIRGNITTNMKISFGFGRFLEKISGLKTEVKLDAFSPHYVGSESSGPAERICKVEINSLNGFGTGGLSSCSLNLLDCTVYGGTLNTTFDLIVSSNVVSELRRLNHKDHMLRATVAAAVLYAPAMQYGTILIDAEKTGSSELGKRDLQTLAYLGMGLQT